MIRHDDYAFENTARAVYIMNDSARERYDSWEELQEFMYDMANSYGYTSNTTSLSTGGFQLTFTRSEDNIDVYITASVSAFVALHYMMIEETNKLKKEIIDALQSRLNDINRATELKYPIQDEFEMGIDCRVANEQHWLEELLDKIKER